VTAPAIFTNFTFGLAKWLEAQGVDFRMGKPVEQLSSANGETRVNGEAFDGVVVCAGVGSRAMAKKLGDRVNIYPVKGYSITVNMPDAISQDGAPMVSLLDDDAKIVTSRLGKDRFRVAGTAEYNGENRDIRADRIEPLTKWVETHFPSISTEHVVPLGRSAPDDAKYDAARWRRQTCRCFLQHRSRAFGAGHYRRQLRHWSARLSKSILRQKVAHKAANADLPSKAPDKPP
jgi:glycine/D-amino acid oxidase-like deaminating enzyme